MYNTNRTSSISIALYLYYICIYKVNFQINETRHLNGTLHQYQHGQVRYQNCILAINVGIYIHYKNFQPRGQKFITL